MATPGDCIVIDNGSGTIKAGFALEPEPRLVEKPLAGWLTDEDDPKSRRPVAGLELRLAGVEGQSVLERGYVTDWDGAEAVWKQVVTGGLKVDPADHPILITEPALNPKTSRERTAEILMESVGCAGVYLAVPGMLSLFATGRTSGLVLDAGHQQTTIVPVFQGYQLRPGTQTLPLGGYDVTNSLLKALVARGHHLNTPSSFDAISTAKEKVCYVSADFETELSETLDNDEPDSRCDYALPDGSTVTVDKERFLSPEALFKPSLIGKSISGIHVAAVEGIINCDRNIHSLLFDNVLLAGGATCTKGLEPRLYEEMLLVAPPMTKIRYVETKAKKRPMSAWTGGAMLAQLGTFEVAYVKRWEYEEYGPSIVHQKCF